MKKNQIIPLPNGQKPDEKKPEEKDVSVLKLVSDYIKQSNLCYYLLFDFYF